MSGKKDALVNIGGWLALNDRELYEEASNLVVVYEGLHTYGGMAGRDMEAMARGIVESVDDDHIRARIGQVEYLGQKLIDWACRSCGRSAGTRSFSTPRRSTRTSARTSSRAGAGGRPVRGRRCARDGARHRLGRPRRRHRRTPLSGLELVRLTIPRRVYTQAHMDVTAESVAAVFDERHTARGFRMVHEPRYLRFFQARFEPLAGGPASAIIRRAKQTQADECLACRFGHCRRLPEIAGIRDQLTVH